MKSSVVFGNQSIGLRSSCSESIQHNDARRQHHASPRFILLAEENSELVHEMRCERRRVAVEKSVFAMAEIPSGLAKHSAADALVFHILVLRFEAQADAVLRAELVSDLCRCNCGPLWIRDVVSNDP